MDAIKVLLNREVALGYWMFLESEKMRHLEDVRMIEYRQKQMVEKYNIQLMEQNELIKAAENFIEIE